MNPTMLAAPAVHRHLETLSGDGWNVLCGSRGRMACGDEGAGRLPEPEAIVAWLAGALAR
jgi:phosphopantothenoylcysteine decarboxylase/phosphopantothenate--cysteine ligase